MPRTVSQTTICASPVQEKAHLTLQPLAPVRRAEIAAWGQRPKLIEAPTPASPGAGSDEIQVQVSSTALHALVRHRGSGKHYSAKTLPHIPGVDGVGTTTDGRQVYFHTIGTSKGSFADIVNVPSKNICELPTGLNKLQVSALVNPVMSSYMAIRKRTTSLPANFTVCILGATSMSGKLAITICRALGAGKVIGCARNEEKLKALGLEQYIVLQDEVEKTDFRAAKNIDVVLDYLWGQPALTMLSSLPISYRTQWIQIGGLAGTEISLPHHVIRSRNLSLIGAGIGSWTVDEFAEELPGLLSTMRRLQPQSLNIVALSQVETEWFKQSSDRTVFVC